MTAEKSPEQTRTDGRKSSESEKARLERQSAALRENLRRRNAQRRGRESGENDSGITPEKS
ncbi:MAG: hypothetical protein HOJ90_06705 [Alphaproteobacteria bacterium]|jgi:hypothetical protein|nr:hypothetical protein [Alphaproteobacteria bacterium]